MRFARGCLAVCLLVGLLGCGPTGKLASVSGTVRYKGQPLPNAYVAFLPEQSGERIATGTTDSGGRYRLTTFGRRVYSIGNNPQASFLAAEAKNLVTMEPTSDKLLVSVVAVVFLAVFAAKILDHINATK